MKISKRHISYLKYVLAVLILGFLIYQIKTANSQEDIKYILTQKDWTEKIYLLIFVIVLMPVNWFLESLKWKKLMKSFLNISIKDAIKAVLVGVSFGVVTPARLGEYGGRVLMTP